MYICKTIKYENVSINLNKFVEDVYLSINSSNTEDYKELFDKFMTFKKIHSTEVFDKSMLYIKNTKIYKSDKNVQLFFIKFPS